MFETINNNIIKDWFSNEFYKVNGKSIYGDVPEKFKDFYQNNVTDKQHVNALDLGYGDGRFTNFLLNARNVNVTAVDISISNIIGKKNLIALKKDIRDFEYKKEQFDLIISNETLNYINDSDFISILKAIEVCVKPSGFIYLSILCDFKRIYIESNTEFKWSEQIDMSVNDCLTCCTKIFKAWEIIDSTIYEKSGERPINKRNKLINPYKWKANNLFFIAKKYS